MAAPSLDFHCTTSRVARRKSLYCAATSVRYLRREIGDGRDEDFGEAIGRGSGSGEGAVILGEGRAGGVEGIRPADAADGAGRGVDAEEMGGGLLGGREIDAVRPPVEQVGVFVEFLAEQARLAAFGGNHGDVAVGVVEELLAVGRGVGDLFAVGRPLGIAVRARGVEQLLDMKIGEVEHVESLGIARAEVGIARSR